MLKRWLLYVGSVVVGLGLVGALLCAFVLALLWPTLPPLTALTDYQPKVPLRVVSSEGDLLGEFGEERRAIVAIREVPDVMRRAGNLPAKLKLIVRRSLPSNRHRIVTASATTRKSTGATELGLRPTVHPFGR